MSALPESDAGQIASLRSDYESCSKEGGRPASEACFRCVAKSLQTI